MSRSKSSQSEKKNPNKKIHFALNTGDESRSVINVVDNDQNAGAGDTQSSKLILQNESFHDNTNNTLTNNNIEFDNLIEPINDDVSLSVEDEQINNNNNIDDVEDDDANYVESLSSSIEKNLNIKVELEEKININSTNNFNDNNNNILLTSSPNNLNTNTPVSSLSSFDQDTINPLTTGSMTGPITTSAIPNTATTNASNNINNQNNFHSNFSSYSNYSSNIRTNLIQTYNYLGQPVYETHLINHNATSLTTPNTITNTNSNSNNTTTSNSKKKIIKVQDCTAWLTISNPKNSYQTMNKSANIGNNLNSGRNGINSIMDTCLDSPKYYSNLNRINMLLNRRVPRVNT
jgi:hypothetical protein